jgi:hypothetical protein
MLAALSGLGALPFTAGLSRSALATAGRATRKPGETSGTIILST